MSKLQRKREISTYLYEDLGILDRFNFYDSVNINYIPIRSSYTERDDKGNKLFTVQADPNIRRNNINKYNPVDIKSNINILAIGIDASSVPTQCLCHGNTRYIVVKPYIICAKGEDALFILEEISQTIKYLILISNKLNLAYKKSKSALYPHYKLQNNLVNTLKHIKEGKLFADFIEKIVNVAVDYGYTYNSNSQSEENLIIFKDGPILSNSEMKLSHALFNGNTNTLRGYMKLYNAIKYAGDKNIPIVGIVKDSQALILSKLFTPFGSDYQILRNLAYRQNAEYSYLNPIKKIIEPYRNIQIDNYFTFLERGISPLRLEVIPEFKPKTIKNFSEIIERTIQLIHQNDTVHEFHRNKYRLPYCILYSDLSSRYSAKHAKQMIVEKLKQIRRNIPIPMVLKQGFE